MRFLAHGLFVVMLFAASAVSAATAQLCGTANQCVCIFWTSGSSGYVEVRCPEGSSDPTAIPPGSSDTSSWDGPPTNYTPLGSAPGTALFGADAQAVSAAELAAYNKLRRRREPDMPPGTYLPNDCADLFNEAPWSDRGAWIVYQYAIYRSGEGVTDDDGNKPCDSGIPAWTTCCRHEPYVFICDSFKNQGTTDQALTLIHEGLHVAGQMEDKDGTFGPGDPPNTTQIREAVKKACE